MDDKELKQLFEDFEPELTSDDVFMHKIEKNMKMIEMVRATQMVDSKRNKRIAIFSFVVGFLSGVVLTLCYPWILVLIQSLVISLSPTIELSQSVIPIGVWILISAVSLCSTLGTYSLIKINLRERIDSHVP